MPEVSFHRTHSLHTAVPQHECRRGFLAASGTAVTRVRRNGSFARGAAGVAELEIMVGSIHRTVVRVLYGYLILLGLEA